MPYDKGLAQRLEAVLDGLDLNAVKMFGGLGFLLNGNLCLGIYREFLIVRVGREAAEKILREPHVLPMDITGRPMQGWARIGPEGVLEDADLKRFCDPAIDFVGSLPGK